MLTDPLQVSISSQILSHTRDLAIKVLLVIVLARNYFVSPHCLYVHVYTAGS